ncbi:MAG TPA: helix-turn-helix domain-containing protein [Candidatus Pygmaiobacter gallistercoris]|nr:helix-turn-helix domain-containing protein [Candidatus Pygmaiobacter gallistercoris]
MDQKKTGARIGALRREKGLTQEQLAERLGVSRRTVSRWETGSNLPDLDLLLELADLFSVELRMLLTGEGETARQLADYAGEEKQRLRRRMNRLFLVGVATACLSLPLAAVTPALGDFAQGALLGILLVGALMTSRWGERIRAAKRRLLRRGA